MPIPKKWVKQIAKAAGSIWEIAIKTWHNNLPTNQKPLSKYTKNSEKDYRHISSSKNYYIPADNTLAGVKGTRKFLDL